MAGRGTAIQPTNFGRPHVVLLGAGASLATCPNGDENGRVLPLMNSLVDVVGLAPLLKAHGLEDKATNFEALYSTLIESNEYDEILYEVENRIFRYLKDLRLPENPTLYDHLLLCLRRKDVVATFNWDPLLPQAMHRIAKRFGQESLPQVFFLHGNVAIGYCHAHEPPTQGFVGNRCSECGNYLSRSRMLFPVTHKDYTEDPDISRSWSELKKTLAPGNAFVFTIFGYGAPTSDVDAVSLLTEAWGDARDRELEQIEIIDIRSSEELHESWSAMICRDHYWTMKEFYQSLIALHPRRSCESFWEAVVQNNPQEERRIPRNASWEELDAWATPLIEEERDA